MGYPCVFPLEGDLWSHEYKSSALLVELSIDIPFMLGAEPEIRNFNAP